jgi:hypothetical protein
LSTSAKAARSSESETNLSVKTLSPSESSERRLVYTPLSEGRSSSRRSNSYTRSSNSVASASRSVYERLYPNKPRQTPVMVIHGSYRNARLHRIDADVRLPQIPVPLHLQMHMQHPRQRIIVLVSKNVASSTRRKKLYRGGPPIFPYRPR